MTRLAGNEKKKLCVKIKARSIQKLQSKDSSTRWTKTCKVAEASAILPQMITYHSKVDPFLRSAIWSLTTKSKSDHKNVLKKVEKKYYRNANFPTNRRKPLKKHQKRADIKTLKGLTVHIQRRVYLTHLWKSCLLLPTKILTNWC